jgi:hypothetical protein
MKQFQSTTENNWVEIKPVQLTESQRTLLMSFNVEDKIAKNELIEQIKSQRELEVNQNKMQELNDFYNSVKPELKQTDIYQLISIDFSEKTQGIFNGILNCRINGEHKQIRF